MDNRQLIMTELQQSVEVLNGFINESANAEAINEAATLIINAINDGGKIICCGNGGSHCVAMHFAEELTGRYRENRNPIPALSISDPGHISCVANEYGYEFIFSRFVDAIGQPEDVVLTVSTSGNSANVIQAAQSAKRKGMKVIALTGKNGGKLGPIADVEVRVPHFGFADRIHEIHYKIVHILIVLIEKHV
jgi:D-sedoheptulose 7-phosphate isomerase